MIGHLLEAAHELETVDFASWQYNLYYAPTSGLTAYELRYRFLLTLEHPEDVGNPFLWSREKAYLRRLIAFIDCHPTLPPRFAQHREFLKLFQDFEITNPQVRQWISLH